MARPHVVVRKVDDERFDDLSTLWQTHRVESGATPSQAQRWAVDGALRTALDRRDVVAFVGYHDGRPVGYAVVSDGTVNPFVETPCVAIEHVYVLPSRRRDGTARALLAAVAKYADRVGATQVASSIPSNGREAHRFFARLGFSPVVVRRITTTAALQRRLAGESSRNALEAVLARRRSARIRAAESQDLEGDDTTTRMQARAN